MSDKSNEEEVLDDIRDTAWKISQSLGTLDVFGLYYADKHIYGHGHHNAVKYASKEQFNRILLDLKAGVDELDKQGKLLRYGSKAGE